MWGVFFCLLGYSAALKRVVGEDALANGTCSGPAPENSSLAQFAGMDECTDKYEGDMFDAAAMAEMLLAEECQMFIVDTEEGDEEEIGFSLGQDMFVYHVLRFFQGKQVSYDGLDQVLAVLRETKETADADVVRVAIKLVQRLQGILAFDKCEARFKKESMAGGFNPKQVAMSLASAECRAFHAENGELQQRLLGILKTFGSYPEWKQVQQKAEELLAKYSKAKNVAAYEWAVAYAQQAKRYWRDVAPKVGHNKSVTKKSQDDAESLPSSPELASPVAELPANAGSTTGCEEDVDCGALKAARKVEQAAAEKFKKCCEQDVVPAMRRALSFDRKTRRDAGKKKRQEREQRAELGKPTMSHVPAHGGHNIAEELHLGIGRSISGVGRSVSRIAKTDRKPPSPPPEPSTPSARIDRSSSGLMGRLRKFFWSKAGSQAAPAPSASRAQHAERTDRTVQLRNDGAVALEFFRSKEGSKESSGHDSALARAKHRHAASARVSWRIENPECCPCRAVRVQARPVTIV
jgi:hypothetical protein